jgi:hypothetical protein
MVQPGVFATKFYKIILQKRNFSTPSVFSPKKRNTMKQLQKCLLLCLMLYVTQSTAQGLDTLTNLNNPTAEKFYYKSATGKVYKFRVAEADWTDRDTNDGMFISQNCLDSIYDGKDRATPKTTFATGTTKTYATVSHLINALPKDSVMRKKVKRTTSVRVLEEQKNVRLKQDTYIYAFAKEDDGDYHVIIGDHIDATKATFFNVEISGLPKDNASAKLKSVYRVFNDRFREVCSSRYLIFDDAPVKIDVQGSLFFDVSHRVGQVGPENMKPMTNWEIHPVGKIVFLD